MALVSGQRSSSSTLNPNAPLFVPAVYREVEDFSPEWWELVKTSGWFCDFWLSQHPEWNFDGGHEEEDDDDDVTDLLPEDFEFDDMIKLDETTESIDSLDLKKFDGAVEMTALLKDLSVQKSPKERSPKSPPGPAKYHMKPAHYVSPKCASRRIHQPR